MNFLVESLIVGAAGFCGAILRFAVQNLCVRLFGPSFPIGTLLINISGSCLLGWFLTLQAARWPMSDALRLAVSVGFVGSYTTFSTWAYDSHVMLATGESLKAAVNLLGSMALGLAAVHLGVWLAARS